MPRHLMPTRSEFHALGAEAHAALVTAAEQISDDGRGLSAWSRLEQALLSHLRAEEDLLLPEFDLGCPMEAANIRREHQRLRELSSRLGAELRENRNSADTRRELLSLLRANAGMEDEALYTWADQRLRPRKKGEFVVRTRRHLSVALAKANPGA